VEDAISLEDLGDRARVAQVAVAPLASVRHLPTVEVGDELAGRLALGQTIPLAEEARPGPIAVAHAGSLLAIGEAADGVLRPRKVFAA
jgi:hypothetical protein